MAEHAWHSLSPHEALRVLESTPKGLSLSESASRALRYGPNALADAPRETWLHIFFRQFVSPLIFLLIISGAILGFMGDVVDAVIITLVLVFNALVGAIQEGKAQRSLEALKTFSDVFATVRRGGFEVQVHDTELVPGDVIIVREGERLSVDARLLSAHGLQIDEAALTGESFPVRKSPDTVLAAETPVADRRNMLYRGTSVLSGSAVAVVVETGMRTVLGGIARAVVGIDTEMPLKKSIRSLTRAIMVAVSLCLVILIGLGMLRGLPIREIFAIAVSLTVSVVPEGLPIVMTIILATGVWRMAKRNVLVRKLQAVEALGRATVIAVDKTGTITKNEIMVTEFVHDGVRYAISGSGYVARGSVTCNGEERDTRHDDVLRLVATIAAAGASASVVPSKETGGLKVIGDPTEAALGVFAGKVGIAHDEVQILNQLPFSYTHKFQVIEMKYENKLMIAVIGAPEVLLHLSKKEWMSSGELPLSDARRKGIERSFLSMSDQGLRVVACAIGSIPETFSYEAIGPLSFVGLYGMQDAIRSDAREAVRRCEHAGLRVVMMTGDHVRTAVAIARMADIFHDGDAVLEGAEMEAMTDAQLSKAISSVTVFARVTPDHKLRIVRAFQRRGDVVAMTGDGVNDVPSIVAADLGVAMGKIGTEVTKSAADIVLLDDRFGNIVHGVEEGRHMFIALKRVTMYLFSTNVGEILTLLAALVLGLPMPLLAVQIVWLNVVTDTFLDVSLSLEPKEQALLDGRTQVTGSALIDRPAIFRMIPMVIVMAAGTLWFFAEYAWTDIARGWTMALTMLAVFQWMNALNCRSTHRSIFQMSPFSNRPLLVAMAAVITLQLLAVYHPIMQSLFRTVPLSLHDWSSILLVSLSIIVVDEIGKYFTRLRLRKLV